MQAKKPDHARDVFSDYVARLGPDGDPPDLASLEKVRKALRSVVIGQLKRRGLWSSPPSFLGLPGAKWDRDTLDELVSDAYVFNFVRRLRGLRDQQRLKPDLRPMVIKNVGNFLTELQKKADPLGYRVFGRLRQAAELAVESGRLFVLKKKSEEEKPTRARPAQKKTKKHSLHNNSLIGFEPTAAPTATPADLGESVRRWNDELLPRLITAEGRAVPREVRRLAEKLTTLRDADVTAFCLGDLAAELKSDIRRRWQGIWHDSLGELGKEQDDESERSVNVGVTPAEEEPDWPRRQALIEECVANSIDRQRPLGNRRDLWSLWTLISNTRLPRLDDGPLPSYTELGRQLQLTRDRVRQLFGRLKPLVLACLGADRPSQSHRSPRPDNDSSPGDLTYDSTAEMTHPPDRVRRHISPAGGR